MPFNPFYTFFPEGDDDTTFRRFLDSAAEGFDLDAMPLATIVQHYKTARVAMDRPNLSLFHYADMKRDLAGTFDRVAACIGVTDSPETMSALVQAATFDNMKSNAERYAPPGGKGFFLSDKESFNSGTSDKWKGVLRF